MARLQRVFVDTNELFPFTIMDTLLSLAEERIFSWVWTDELIDEWERVIVREQRRSTDSAAAIVKVVRTFFANERLEPSKYLPLMDESLSPDPDDRVHAAACLSGEVDVLVTRNHRDFPLDRLTEARVAVMSSDDYLVSLLGKKQRAVVEAVGLTASRKRNPPKTPCELVADLRQAGAPKFASRLMPLLGCEWS